MDIKAKSVEFSLMGLAGLLAEHGFRVVSGSESGKRDCRIERMSDEGSRRVFFFKEISLTVALETPEADGAEPAASEN